MTPERHQQVCEIVYQALELAAKDRSAFLDQACLADHSLRREVESLLASSEDVRSSFLGSSTLRLTLTPGMKLGEYEVEALVGSGGMGEVYRARDLRLGRAVAIKVLPTYLSADASRLARFEQEARAAAALNHPNILAVYQLGQHEHTPYLVTELLEGETLRGRINRGRLPAGEAIDVCTQVGKGLVAAHAKGILHRDLKPENLYMTRDNVVKILDFGLAKLIQTPSAVLRNAPEQPGSPATEPGMLLGTVGYMSPEQARGQPADARSDIFSLGAVLYEMLTGRPAFQRGNLADSLSSILNNQPPAVTSIAAGTSGGLQRVVQRCLEKQPEKRFQSAADLVQALEAAEVKRGSKLKWLVLAAVVILALGLVAREAGVKNWVRRRPEFLRIPTERSLTANSPDNPVMAYAISRDGKYVAYRDNSDKINLLLVDSGDVRQLPLDSPYEPVDWFPDGVHLLVRRARGEPGLWNFSNWDSSLHKVWDRPTETDDPTTAARVSPDGTSIAVIAGQDHPEIWLMGPDGEEPHKILDLDAKDSVASVVWSPTGRRLAYIRERGTFAKHECVIETAGVQGGSRETVLSEPLLLGRDGVANLSWLPDGRIVYALSAKLDQYSLFAIATNVESGVAIDKPRPIADWTGYSAARIQSSADGKRLLALKRHSEDGIYLGSVGRKVGWSVRRLLQDRWQNAATAWTKDGKSVLFYSKRNGRWTVCKQDLSDGGPETLISGPENYRDAVESAGGTLLYTAFSSPDVEIAAGNWRLMSTPMAGGPRNVLINGRYSYECSTAPASGCVVADLHDQELIFSGLDPVTGKYREIARYPGFKAGTTTSNWSLSPDRSRIAIADRGENIGVLHILNLETGKVALLNLSPWKWRLLTSVSWAADGQGLFAIAETESSVALLSVSREGRLSVLQEVDKKKAWLFWPLASPDGRFLAFSMRTYQSDLVMLENF